MIEQLKTIRSELTSLHGIVGDLSEALTALSDLESHLAQYEAGDMASAAAQGFRDGVASVAQPQEPVAYYYQKHNCFGQLVWNVGFVAPGDATHCYPLYTTALVAQQPQARPDFTDEWTGYLKDGETPFERFLRERKDVQSALKLYQRALEENERLKTQQPQAKPDIHEAQGQIEFLDRKNNALSAAIRKVMARLADLLDEDQFKEIEETISSAGVQPQAECRNCGGEGKFQMYGPAWECRACNGTGKKQPQAEAVSDDLRDRLVAIGQAIADQDDRAAQAMIREILAAPQQAEAVPQAAEFCWLVEHFDIADKSTGLYYTGKVGIADRALTTMDPHQAKRYDTWRAANIASAQLGSTLTGTWRAMQHGFHRMAPQQAETVPSDVVRDADLALDLLSKLFDAYENGLACYEDPDEQAGYLGNAVELDADTIHACADLLNRRRPIAAIAQQKGQP